MEANHPRKFRYIVLSRKHNQPFEEFYETLAHELIHVATAQKDGIAWKHQEPFMKNGRKYLKDINQLASELPMPFTGMLLGIAQVLKAKP